MKKILFAAAAAVVGLSATVAFAANPPLKATPPAKPTPCVGTKVASCEALQVGNNCNSYYVQDSANLGKQCLQATGGMVAKTCKTAGAILSITGDGPSTGYAWCSN